ncbi:hypothetical protein E4U43_002157 [Claviceps pusilla]|uniref:Uncharacterized protein n=1 Tax=Claviceps pusilla TaxID=123648 RepID=A0A9P7N784_9HYPO|nr:hypothetical protein E4U43_002157 [Claviceps pusilla]
MEINWIDRTDRIEQLNRASSTGHTYLRGLDKNWSRAVALSVAVAGSVHQALAVKTRLGSLTPIDFPDKTSRPDFVARSLRPSSVEDDGAIRSTSGSVAGDMQGQVKKHCCRQRPTQILPSRAVDETIRPVRHPCGRKLETPTSEGGEMEWKIPAAELDRGLGLRAAIASLEAFRAFWGGGALGFGGLSLTLDNVSGSFPRRADSHSPRRTDSESEYLTRNWRTVRGCSNTG